MRRSRVKIRQLVVEQKSVAWDDDARAACGLDGEGVGDQVARCVGGGEVGSGKPFAIYTRGDGLQHNAGARVGLKGVGVAGGGGSDRGGAGDEVAADVGVVRGEQSGHRSVDVFWVPQVGSAIAVGQPLGFNYLVPSLGTL